MYGNGGFSRAGLAKVGLASATPHIAVIGDSITVADFNGSDKVTNNAVTNRNSQASGFMAWALALSGQRVTMPLTTNVWGFPGKETDVILANLPAFLAQMPQKPGAVVVEVGTNNLFRFGLPQESFAFITADWTSIATLLANQGIRTIFVPILPRGTGFSALLPAASFATMDKCNRWLNEFASRSRGMVAVASKCLLPLTDPAATNDQIIPKANMMVDGTHPGPGGGYLIGSAIADILNNWYPPVDHLPASNFRNAAGYPDANALTNAMMTGSSGGVNGPVTGAAPANWNVGGTLPAGVTAASAIVTGADGIRRTQFTISGTYTVTGAPSENAGYFARLYQQLGTADAALIMSGDTMEALCDFEIDAGHTHFLSPRLQFRTRASIENNAMYPQMGFLPLGQAIKGVLRTAPHTYAAAPANSETGLFAYLHLPGSNGTYNVNATVRVGRPVIRRAL
jgi:GDSL-like Lipase/Acylhydrolase family